jgi:hypothetical protein
MKQTVTRIEAIYDRDHGQQNEGWYIRLTLHDGQKRDVPLDGGRLRPSVRRVRNAAREEARSWGWEIASDVQVRA